jgi:hypothetical protein
MGLPRNRVRGSAGGGHDRISLAMGAEIISARKSPGSIVVVSRRPSKLVT